MFRFVMVGGLGMAVNTVALYMFYGWFSLPLLVASILAVEISIVHNYLLNNRWTFGGRWVSPQRFVKFNISALGGLAMNSATMWLLARLGLYYLVANALGAFVAFFVNYALSAHWVWREGL